MHNASLAIMATGGMDSTVLLYENQDKRPAVLTVDYGQVAFSKQLEMLDYHTKKLGLGPPQVIKVYFQDWQCQPGLFTPGYKPNENNPLQNWDDLRYKDFFVEGRNLIMVAYVLAYCSVNKIDELLAGYLYSEEEWEHRDSYKLLTGDNSPQFVDMINLISQLGFSHRVRFRAPYYERRWSKKDVYDYGLTLGVDFNMTYSCYFVPPCGVCDNCLLRKKLLEET